MIGGKILFFRIFISSNFEESMKSISFLQLSPSRLKKSSIDRKYSGQFFKVPGIMKVSSFFSMANKS